MPLPTGPLAAAPIEIEARGRFTMKQILSIISAVGLAMAGWRNQTKNPAVAQATASAVTGGEKVARAAQAEIGVVEATGQNDGQRVEWFQKQVGLSKGDPWCSAFIYAVSKLALGVSTPYPRTGWSPTMVAGGKAPGTAPLAVGGVAGFYFPAKGRIAHVEIVTADHGGKWVTTVGGNTGSGAGIERDGGGVYKRARLRSSISKFKQWVF